MNTNKTPNSCIYDYALKAHETAIYQHPDYPVALLVNEASEVLDKVAKYGRKNNMPMSVAVSCIVGSEPDLKEAVAKELGDVIWAWVETCHVFGLDPAEVMKQNIEKLAARAAKGTLEGSGDNR